MTDPKLFSHVLSLGFAAGVLLAGYWLTTIGSATPFA